MIIGIDASRANRPHKTGVGWYAFHIIQELKRIVPDTHCVYLYTDAPLSGELAELPEHWQEKVLVWPPRRLWTHIRLSYEMLVRPPDVLFVPAHVAPLMHPRKTTVTIHDIAALRFPDSYTFFERWYSTWSARYACKKIAKIIVPSEFTKQELMALCDQDAGAKISVVQHGADDSYAAPLSADTAVIKKYDLKQPYILYVGRLEHKKNTSNLVRAFGMVAEKRDVHLVLAGLPGYGYHETKQAIAESKHAKNIHELGWIPEEELSALMASAKMLALISRYEGFGIPVLEAMRAGIPVLASRRGSLPEVAADAALYVQPERPNDIAAAMERLLADPELAASLVQKGRERVRGFSWGKAASQTFAQIVS